MNSSKLFRELLQTNKKNVAILKGQEAISEKENQQVTKHIQEAQKY